MPRTFLYRCPNTGQTVQGWSPDEATDEDDTYQSFECTFCTRVHLVNLKTGKLLGEEDDRRVLPPLGLVGSISVGQGRLAAPTESDPKLASPV